MYDNYIETGTDPTRKLAPELQTELLRICSTMDEVIVDEPLIYKWRYTTEEFTLEGMFTATRDEIHLIPNFKFQFDHLEFQFKETDLNTLNQNRYINEVPYSAEHVRWFTRHVGVIGVNLIHKVKANLWTKN